MYWAPIEHAESFVPVFVRLERYWQTRAFVCVLIGLLFLDAGLGPVERFKVVLRLQKYQLSFWVRFWAVLIMLLKFERRPEVLRLLNTRYLKVLIETWRTVPLPADEGTLWSIVQSVRVDTCNLGPV